ncbi:MAG: fibronectin type III domain-containing protein [Actinobacteria bacterium]|nr:fibronectin type III domain-containing protein [Actinomycetota bacterium]MCB8996600.1 fibronectin type III domain-containing protein [Actinomycetota bacterium]MCB9415043.1 fibronectin type III domain-containing protein [Actinomycetota bacterium]HRY10187.1 fibronectin type III domain-containing protein [Candidatus Nanopelagicales bacterium]
MTRLRRLGALLLALGLLGAIAPTAHASSTGTLGLSVTARYVDGGSGPLVGALVTAENLDNGLVYPVPAYGDPATSSYYQAIGLPFGRYRLRIERLGFATMYWPHQYSRETATTITFGNAVGCNPSDSATCDLHILTAQSDQLVTVSGTVRRRTGQPQPGAVVTATRRNEPTFHPSAVSDASGAFTLRLPGGGYDLTTPNGNAVAQEVIEVSGPTSRDLTLLSVPDMAREVLVATGSRQASVFWRPPADDGGAAITSYTVTTTPGGATCSTSSTSCTFTGLQNGQVYTFRVSAANRIGSGAAAPVEALVSAGAPSPARNVRVTSADRALEVTWSASASDDVREYVATATPGGKSCSTADLACSIRGLRNGREYRVSVIARTPDADGVPATAARPVAPLGLPGAPRDVRVTPAPAALKVDWRAPRDDGGHRITEYVATAWPGGKTCQTQGNSKCTIRGLRKGTAFSVTVRAANRAGVGAMSPGSAPLEVTDGPAAPRKVAGLRARRTNSAVVATWRPSERASSYWVRLRTKGQAPGTWSVVRVARARFAHRGAGRWVEVRAVGRSGPGPIARAAVD